jgi:O-succinylbenzoic acid--CoA ligase
MAEFFVNPDFSKGERVKWEGDSSYLFFNPRWPSSMVEKLHILQKLLKSQPGRIWMMTSGSEAFPKCIGLKKTGVLAAAAGLAKRYDFQGQETWLNGLPTFHIGGLSIWARAHLSLQKVVVQEEWEPREFHRQLLKENVQWTSLVPTQIYDLVQLDLTPPPSLRGIFVGGGALSGELYQAGRDLKWPLLPTYGMTEACSQIATASLEALTLGLVPELEILDHVDVRINEADGRVGLKGPSITDVIYRFDAGEWKKENPRDPSGTYWTQDCGEIKDGRYFYLSGRADDMKKVRGELVSLSRLQSRLDQVLLELKRDLGPVITLLPDPRTGYRVALVVEPSQWNGVEEVQKKLRGKCAPYGRVESLYILRSIPRSELGKLRRGELEKLLLANHPVIAD